MAKVGEIFIGARFGRLEITAERTIGGGQSCVAARCDCGVEKSYQVSNLGNTTFSCGCLGRDQTSKRSQTHRLSKTAEYQIWSGIVKRCTNPNFDAWHNYGGRGIRICDEWRYNFVAFLKHVGPRPGPEFSIDRIDNDGNYEPGNVRWATPSEQRANQRLSNVCKRGHPLVGDNILVRPNQRQCKKCTRQNRAEYERVRRRKEKEAAAMLSPRLWIRTDMVFAPFTPDEVASLNAYQASGTGRSFTCETARLRAHPPLTVTEQGLACPVRNCEYSQDWAWMAMADWAWTELTL